MRNTLILVFFLTLSSNLNSQSFKFDWVKHIYGTVSGSDISPQTDAVIDTEGNLIILGGFDGTVDFDPGPGITNLTAIDLRDIFIIKLDSIGDLIWAIQIGGIGVETGNSLAIDSANNIYLTGTFNGNCDFDPGPDSVNLISKGNRDFFIEKLNSNGSLVWVKQIGGNGYEESNSIAVDSNENIFITGFFDDSVDFDPGIDTFVLIASGNANSFIEKFDSDGNFLWVKSIDGIGSTSGYKLIIDHTGNIYSIGNMSGQSGIDFDPGPGTFFLSGYGKYVYKLDASGSFVWASLINYSYVSSYRASFIMDNAGNFYLTDSYVGTGDFDPGPGIVSLSTVNSGYSEGFVLKLDSNGQFVWVKQIKGNGNSYEGTYCITSDSSCNVYVSGFYSGFCDFDPGSGNAIFTNSSGSNAFILKLDSASNFIWVKLLEGTFTHGLKLLIHNNNLYDIGTFGNTTDFDPSDGTFFLTSFNFSDLFIDKFAQCQPTYFTDNIVSCNSYKWVNGVTYYSSNNSAIHFETNSTGCDSIMHLNLTINDVSNSITTSNDSTIVANNLNGSFQWVNCDSNYAIINGAISQSYLATPNVNYAVIITENGCVDTSECTHLSLLGINNLPVSELKLYPNPNNGKFFIENKTEIYSDLGIKIYNSLGEIVFLSSFNTIKKELDISEFSNGIYFVTVTYEDGMLWKSKIVKE